MTSYDYLLLSSFEFTCDGKKTVEPQEIIEFCVMKFSMATRQVTDKFYTLVKPQHPDNAALSSFCKMLTCITDRRLSVAPTLEEVLLDFDRWLWAQDLHQKRFIFVPYTHFELQHLLLAQCAALGYHCPAYFFTWLHTQEITTSFLARQVANRPAVKQIRRQNSQTILNSFGIRQVGRPHSAEDNCLNTANLVCAMLEKGVDLGERVWRSRTTPRLSVGEEGAAEALQLDPLDLSERELREEEAALLFGRIGRETPVSRAPTPGSSCDRLTPLSRGPTPSSFRDSASSGSVRGVFEMWRNRTPV